MTIFRCRASGPGPAGDIWINDLHLTSSATLSAVHTAYLAYAAAVYENTMAPLWSTNQGATELETVELDAAGKHQVAKDTDSVQYKGAKTSFPMPQELSIIVSLRTATPTRAGRGRIFVPATTTDDLTATGQFNTTQALAIATAWAQALGAFPSTVTPVIFHRALNTSTPLTRVEVPVTWGVQRRRINKVPGNYQSVTI